MDLKWNKKASGIYCIKNKINHKIYVGKTKNLYGRKYQHIEKLKNGKHVNKHLQFAFNKYGIENFVFEVIEFCELENLGIREFYWMNHYESYKRDKGYNIEILDENGTSIRSYESISKMKKTLVKNKKKYIKPKGKDNPTSKEIFQYDFDGKYLSNFESCHIAAEFLNKKNSYSLISKCARLECGSAFGYQWRYFKVDKISICDSINYQISSLKRNAKDMMIPIIAINLDDLSMHEFNSISEAASILKISISSIARIVKGDRKKSTKLNMTFKYK